MPLADGQVVAGYTILRTLGAGGMGEVYLVQHPRLPRLDALKVLGAAVSGDDEYRQRFGLEADIVATLSHPHIVTIYDRGEFDDKLWIAMEYIDGTDASNLLAEHYPYGMPPDEVVRIVSGIAEALDYAHGRGLMHRDIKPANILLGHPGTGDERVMLADFGIARWMGQSSGLTGTNMTVGTVAYAAPEQLKGEDIDGHADQYALAATAYHLLTGMPPFQHTNPAIVISQHLSSEPPAIGAKRPELACLAPVFTKALAKDARGRYERCVDFARALERGLGVAARDVGVTAAAPVAAGVAKAPMRARHAKPESVRSRRRLLVPAILGALVVIGGAAAGVFLLLGHRGVHATAAGPHSAPPPPAVAGRMDLPVVVIGANCAVLGAAAVSETGAPAYCAHAMPAAQTTVWSLQPEQLRADQQPTAATPG